MDETTALDTAEDDLIRPSYAAEPSAAVEAAHADDRAAETVTSRGRRRGSVAIAPARGSLGEARP